MIRVVGIGSPHGDDQIGWRLVQEIGSLEGVSVQSSLIATPIDLLDTLDGIDLLVLVDACDSGRPPGSVLVRGWPCDCEEHGRTSSHGLGIASALRLADQLGKLPRRVVLFGVQAGSSRTGDHLSPEVERVLPQIAAQLRMLIRILGREPDERGEIGAAPWSAPGWSDKIGGD